MSVAEAVEHIGISSGYLSGLEGRNLNSPSLHVLHGIIDVLGINEDEVYAALKRFSDDMTDNVKK